MCSIQFQSLIIFFLMAYFKAKLKNNGDKAFPRFSPFWIGNVSDKRLHVDFTKGFIQTHFN